MSYSKCDISVEPKASKEGYGKYKAESCYMRRDNNKAKIHKPLTHNKMVEDKIPQGVKHHICTSTYPIAKDIARYKSANLRYVECIYSAYQQPCYHLLILLWSIDPYLREAILILADKHLTISLISASKW